MFLRFVWGRTRLPRTIADFRGRDFVLQVLEKMPPDLFLPESYTCFFLLKMPRYSCKVSETLFFFSNTFIFIFFWHFILLIKKYKCPFNKTNKNLNVNAGKN